MLFLFAPGGLPARFVVTVIQITALIGLFTASARGEENLEYKIKTAYLYNFTKFIIWPENKNPTFNICLMGDNPLQDFLAGLETKTAQNKPIRILRYSDIKQAKDCQIIYFSNADTHLDLSSSGTLSASNLANKLSVGSQAFFAESGGMIGFVLDREKIKLHINLQAIRQSGLEISAKLIEVSTLVGDERP